jgi:uncharacterized protein YidB (DUF937 family)
MSLSDIVGSLFGKTEGGGQQAVITTVIELINKQPGGLNGLIQQFHEKGAGDIIRSWVGTGPNQAISPETLQNVLGSDVVDGIAQKVGSSSEQVSGVLAQVLPHVVDHATPEGEVPAGGQMDMSSVLGSLAGLFAKKGA